MASVYVEKLDEFRVTTGDPRPVLLNYILSLPNYTTALKQRSKLNQDSKAITAIQKLTNKNSLIYNCKASKRALLHPEIKRFKQNPEAPLVIMPILLRSSSKCKLHDSARHLNILLFNTTTQELERIDIKKYHLKGFSLKLLIKRAGDTLLPLLKTVYNKEELSLVSDLDTNFAFASKIGKETLREAYPAFVVAYINLRAQYPHLSAADAQAKVNNMSRAKIAKSWNDYTAFNLKAAKSDNEGCYDAGYIKNHATNRCMNVSSKAYIKHLVNPPPLPCKGDKVFNHFLRKCTTGNKLFDVDIMYKDTSESSLTRKNEMKRIQGALSQKAAMFIMSKYPNAYLVCIDQNELTIIWKELADGTFSLKYPPQFWESWSRAMYDGAIRFIMAFVSVRAQGSSHANVIIYDKTNKELERFDPHGQWEIEKFNHKGLDLRLHEDFAAQKDVMPAKFKYLTPAQFCPSHAIFQAKEGDEIPGEDLKGNCAVWRLWYISIRLANPNVPRKELILIAQRKLEEKGSLYKFIKSYTLYILQNLNRIKQNE